MAVEDEGRLMDPPEEWRPVKGYEGLYDCSDWGRVRSHDRYVLRKGGMKALWKGRILKLHRGSKGHYSVNLFKDGVPKTSYVHQLVAEAFIPNPEKLPLVRHLDDVKENNGVSNLAWGTHSDNRQDALRNGVKYGANVKKTHCAQGHPFSGDNLYITPDGRRACRTCKRNHWRVRNGVSLDTPVTGSKYKYKEENNGIN